MKLVDFIIKFASQGDNAVVAAASRIQNRLQEADTAASRLSSTIGNRLKEAFMSLPGAEFITNPIVALTAGVGTVAKLGMQAEKTATAFSVLVGSQEESAELLGQFNKYADDTVWNRSDVQEAAKTMMGFGVSTESVFKDLKMLGDIAMGDKNKLQSLALVFGQISSAGKLQGQDLLQLINAGYNPLLDISEITGKSVATLRDEMSKGAISADLVTQAFERATGPGGRFEGMISTLADTTSGKADQVAGSITAVLLEIYQLLQPLIYGALSGLNSVLSVVKGIIGFASKISPIIAGITAAVVAYNAVQLISNGLLKGFTIIETIHYGVLLLVEKAQWLLNLAMTANPVGLIVAGIAALIAVLVVCWNKFEGFRAVIKTTWDTIKGFGTILKNYVIDRIQGIISGFGKLGEAISKFFSGDFSGAWEAAKDGASGIVGIDAAANAVTASKELVGGIGQNYQQHKEAEAKKEVSAPSVPGMSGSPELGPQAYGDSASTSKTAEQITTGGTRNTSINLTINRLIESFNVSMESAEDTDDIQDSVVECVNRALEIALSAAR